MKSYMKIKDIYTQNGHSTLSVDYVIDDEIDLDEVKLIEYNGTTYEPVRQGHWIVIPEYSKKAECSSCGYPIEHELVCWWNYCPNCGAKMGRNKVKKMDIKRFKKEIADYTDDGGYVSIPLSILLNTLDEVSECD